MDSPDFFSSDSVRQAGTPRHAQVATFPRPLSLELGGALPRLAIAYETYGALNPARDNTVLICHAISGDSHVARHDERDHPGWWDIAVGPGKPIDTDRYHVICSNVLGGCSGTTGPNSIDPASGRRFGADFPAITVGDMVAAQRRLLDHLNIDRLHAVIGGSMGGQQAAEWALRYPDRVSGCVAIATSARLTSQALAFDIVGRNAILSDPHYNGGQYYDQPARPEAGLSVARMLGHITYLSIESMRDKFDATRYQPRDIPTAFEKHFSVGSYLAYHGRKFVERFDANSYIVLSRAMDYFDLGETAEQIQSALSVARCRWLVLSFTSDWLFPPFQSRQIVDALIANRQPVSFCNIESSCGHDAFLLPDNIEVYGRMMRSFLAHLGDRAPFAIVGRGNAPESTHQDTRIFHAHRVDHERLIELIPPGASVLDLGCGNGDLLERLRARGNSPVMGVEWDEQMLAACINRGFDVVHIDLNLGLTSFVRQQFDYVVLSQTLQSIVDTEGVMNEMLRIGKRGVVSIPNFAYRPLRQMLYREGRAPKTTGLYHHEWYETPNRRFPTIADLEAFCHARDITIRRKVCLDTEAGRVIDDDPNLNADTAIFVISRVPAAP